MITSTNFRFFDNPHCIYHNPNNAFNTIKLFHALSGKIGSPFFRCHTINPSFAKNVIFTRTNGSCLKPKRWYSIEKIIHENGKT